MENTSAWAVEFSASDIDSPVMGYVVTEDPARLCFEVAAADNISDMMFTDGKVFISVRDLPSERGGFAYSMPVSGDERGFIPCELGDALLGEDDRDMIDFFLISSEEAIEAAADYLRGLGHPDISWQFADAAPALDTAAERYIVHILDQYGEPVAGAAVIFCTDATCTPCISDRNGIAAFDGAKDNYHVQLMKVPDGYSFDKDFDMYTGADYGEWAVRVRKD